MQQRHSSLQNFSVRTNTITQTDAYSMDALLIPHITETIAHKNCIRMTY